MTSYNQTNFYVIIKLAHPNIIVMIVAWSVSRIPLTFIYPRVYQMFMHQRRIAAELFDENLMKILGKKITNRHLTRSWDLNNFSRMLYLHVNKECVTISSICIQLLQRNLSKKCVGNSTHKNKVNSNILVVFEWF